MAPTHLNILEKVPEPFRIEERIAPKLQERIQELVLIVVVRWINNLCTEDIRHAVYFTTVAFSIMAGFSSSDSRYSPPSSHNLC